MDRSAHRTTVGFMADPVTPFLPDTAVKGHLGVIYAQCCALGNGFGWGTTDADMDYDSIDLTVKGRTEISSAAVLDSYQLDLQLKCSAVKSIDPSSKHIKFTLKPKNVTDLTARVVVPRLLVVVYCPEEIDHRLVWTTDKCSLHAQAYWANLQNSSKLIVGAGGSGTVLISPDNVFDKASLFRLMQMVSEGKKLPERIDP